MLLEDRKRYILETLNEQLSVTVADLSSHFGMSEVSVRKLLDTMEKEGLVKRTWGGAIKPSNSMTEFDLKIKETKNLKEKVSIAQEAYECIEDGEAVFLDSGSTTLQLARLIKNGPKRNILVGTNALDHAFELVEAEDLQIILVGGELRHNVRSCVGNLAGLMLSKLIFDKSFIGVDHISIDYGMTSPNMREADVKNMIMTASKRCYVLADYSKFGNNSLAQIATVDEMDTLVTDWHICEDEVRQFRDRGVEVLIGSPCE